jgi:RPA family protein
MVCRLLFVAGTLTEKEYNAGERFYGRVADPTGVFEIRKIRPDTGQQAMISGIDIPAFVTVIGHARANMNSQIPSPSIEMIEMREVDRPIRDNWIVRTAEITCERLSLMKDALISGSGREEILYAISEFQVSISSIGLHAEMIRIAMDQVADPSTAKETVAGSRERVLTIIRERAGKKGIPLDELVRRAGDSGIDEASVRLAVRALLEEDECYQPALEVYKPL